MYILAEAPYRSLPHILSLCRPHLSDTNDFSSCCFLNHRTNASFPLYQTYIFNNIILKQRIKHYVFNVIHPIRLYLYFNFATNNTGFASSLSSILFTSSFNLAYKAASFTLVSFNCKTSSIAS